MKEYLKMCCILNWLAILFQIVTMNPVLPLCFCTGNSFVDADVRQVGAWHVCPSKEGWNMKNTVLMNHLVKTLWIELPFVPTGIIGRDRI